MSINANPFARRAYCACCDLNGVVTRHIEANSGGRFLAAEVASAPKLVASKLASRTAAEVVVYVAQTILTQDPNQPRAEAIAVAGDRILAVGTFDDVCIVLGDQPFRVDETLADKVILPGLIEQHLHPILSALSLTAEVIANDDWDLPGRTAKGAQTPEAYRQRLRDAVTAWSSDDIFFSWGYHSYWHGALTRTDLDAMSADKPMAIWHRSCHEFILNSAALEVLGLTEAMTEGHGLASQQADWAKGHFYEKGMDIILPKLMPQFASAERMVAGLNQLKAYLRQSGVTALNEPGAQVSPRQLGLYQSVLGEDDALFTTLLIVDGRTMFDRYGAEGCLAGAAKTIALAPTGKVRFLDNQVKFFADGAIVSQKMQMKDGYLDGHQGEWMTEPQDFKTAWNLFWDAGYQTHTHVNGDLGLEMVLDTLDASLESMPREDHRSVIVHFANSTEEQVLRIARSKAVVSANPYYVAAFADAYGEWGLGPDRADNMTRLGSCVREGASISLHSDMPIGPARPLYNAWAAVNRQTASGRTAGPDQRISVESALLAITIDAARSWRMEHEMGSVTVGKVANLTILDEDPTQIDPMRLKDLVVWGLMFEGDLRPAGAALQYGV